MAKTYRSNDRYSPGGAKCAPYSPCIMLALFSACAWSQTQLATVFGAINDPSGAVIPGAQVTIVNQGTGMKRDALTGMAGKYRLAGLPTGNYALRVEKEGFQTQVREGVVLTLASEVMVNVSLAVGGRQEQVTVSATANVIDNTTSSAGGLVPDQSLTELPLNGRDLFKAAAQRLSKTGSFITDLLVDEHNWSEEARRIFDFDPGTKVTVQTFREKIHP